MPIISTCTASVNVISLLDNLPNENDGLSAAQLKVKFDQAGSELKDYINDVLLSEVEANFATTASVESLVVGSIPDGTISEAKLSFDVATQAELNAFTASINGTASTIISNLATHTASTADHLTIMTTQGDMIYRGASAAARLAKGTALQGLIMNTGATQPQWADSMQSLLTTTGSIVYASSPNTPARLAVDADATKIMGISSSVPAWVARHIEYVASDNLLLSNDTEDSESATSFSIFTNACAFSMKLPGKFRIKFDYKVTGGGEAYYQIIDSEGNVLDSDSTTSTNYATVSYDTDYISRRLMPLKLQLKHSVGGGNYATVRNMRIYGTETEVTNAVTDYNND